MKKFAIGSLFVISLLFLGGCSDNEGTASSSTAESTSEVSSSSSTEETQQVATVTLINEEDEIASKDVSFAADSDLMTIVKENFDVVEDGGMITSIEGVEQNTDEGYYWTYTINEEMVNTGASDTIVKDGDKVVFTYAKF